MRKKHVLLFILLPAIALLFAIFCTSCTSQSGNEQQCDCSFCNELHYETILYEKDFPNFVEISDRTIRFTHDELLDTFNFIADYWEANPYCGIRNAIAVLILCVPHNRVRLGLDSYNEELKVAFRTHVLDAPMISLEDVERGMSTVAANRILGPTIFFDIEAKRSNDALLYNDQQERFTFAELRDTMTLVVDFIWASRRVGQAYEIRNAIVSHYLCVRNNRVIIVLFDYSEELKDDFRAKVTDSPAISLVEWVRPQ